MKVVTLTQVEDKVWIDRACMLLDELNHLDTLTLDKIPHNVNEIISHIKSLKPNHWKPTDKQMEALKFFVDYHQREANAATEGWEQYKNLKSLYDDLIKL